MQSRPVCSTGHQKGRKQRNRQAHKCLFCKRPTEDHRYETCRHRQYLLSTAWSPSVLSRLHELLYSPWVARNHSKCAQLSTRRGAGWNCFDLARLNRQRQDSKGKRQKAEGKSRSGSKQQGKRMSNQNEIDAFLLFSPLSFLPSSF